MTMTSSLCSDSTTNVWQRIACILSYSGNTTDVVLNYSVLILNLIASILISLTWKESPRKRRIWGFGSLIFVVVFQISLCLVVRCYGISIVWCAMAGWIISERKFLKDHVHEPRSRNETSASSTTTFSHDGTTASQAGTQQQATGITQTALCVILLDIGTIIYYVVVSSVITTVAHICAIVLGAILSELSQMSQEGSPARDDTSTTTVPDTDPLLPAGHSVTTSHPPPTQLVKYGLT